MSASAFLLGMGPFAGNAFAQGPVVASSTAFTLNLGSGFYTLSGENAKGLVTHRLSLLGGSYAHLGNNVKLATATTFTIVMSPVLLGISATPRLEGEA